MSHDSNFFRQGFFVSYNKLWYEQQRGKKTLLSLTLICYCHLVGMAKIVRGSTLVRPWNTATWRFGWLTVLVWHCLDLYYKLTCILFKVAWRPQLLWVGRSFFDWTAVFAALGCVTFQVWLSLLRLTVSYPLSGWSCKSEQLCFGLWWFLLLPSPVHGFHFTSWRCLLRIYILYEHWKLRTDISLRLRFAAVVACTFLFCNRTGPLQNGSLAGVAHLLQCNTGVPRAAPWEQKPLFEYKGKSCLNLCTLSTSTQCQ